jgi:methylmalonyl-CoA epimerase
MPTNIEVKARVRDFPALRARAEQLSDTPVEAIPQVDTFFLTEKGRLKLRELGPNLAQLVYYERHDQSGPKRSDYRIFETQDSQGLKAALTLALGVRGVVKKVRYLYLVGQTRLHLDEVEGLGHFMELEVVLRPGQSDEQGLVVAEGLMSKLGIDKADLLEGAYMDLLENGDRLDASPGGDMSKVKAINHVAFVVDDMDRSLSFWRDALGIEVRELRDIPAEKSQVAFLPLAGSELELVLPTTTDSGVAKYLAKRGAGMHHICLEVEDLEDLLQQLKRHGIRLIDDRPLLAANGLKYAFVHPESTGGVLVELYEHAGASSTADGDFGEI